MERWESIGLGVVICVLVSSAFYAAFDVFMQWINAQRFNTEGGGSIPMPYRVRLRGRNSNRSHNEELSLLSEQWVTDERDVVLAIDFDDNNNLAAIAIFLNQAKVEYLRCTSPSSSTTSSSLFNTMLVLRAWSRKAFLDVDLIHLLCPDRDFVLAVNTEHTDAFDAVHSLEMEQGFRLDFQWSLNFVVNDGEMEELWASAVNTCRRLLLSDDSDESWSEFEVSHWPRKRILVNGQEAQKCDLSETLVQI